VVEMQHVKLTQWIHLLTLHGISCDTLIHTMRRCPSVKREQIGLCQWIYILEARNMVRIFNVLKNLFFCALYLIHWLYGLD